MHPSIKDGSLLVVNKLAFGLKMPFQQNYLVRWAAPSTGDVLIFWTPLGDFAVKRCGEMPDETHFTALGDNAPASFDSRSYGPVPVDNVIGKAIGIK